MIVMGMVVVPENNKTKKSEHESTSIGQGPLQQLNLQPANPLWLVMQNVFPRNNSTTKSPYES